jgi:hypothetical protein
MEVLGVEGEGATRRASGEMLGQGGVVDPGSFPVEPGRHRFTDLRTLHVERVGWEL